MKEPTFSTTLSVVRAFLGPKGRIWRRAPGYIIGIETAEAIVVHGTGTTLTEAVRNAFPQTFEKLEAKLKTVRETLANAEKKMVEQLEAKP